MRPLISISKVQTYKDYDICLVDVSIHIEDKDAIFHPQNEDVEKILLGLLKDLGLKYVRINEMSYIVRATSEYYFSDGEFMDVPILHLREKNYYEGKISE